MNDKDLRSLSRRDLVELLYWQMKEETVLKEQIAQLQAQLADRNYKIEKAGTLAEAVVSVNGVLEAVQKSADQYLEAIERAYAETEKTCSEMLDKTKEECRKREEETNLSINAKWKEFQRDVDQYLETHAELEALL